MPPADPDARLAALRNALERLEPAPPRADRLFALGHPRLDAALGGGLARAALHEILAEAGLADAAAATGFGLGLALRAAAGRPLAWIRQDTAAEEIGDPYGAGLAAFGADPDRVILVRLADSLAALRAAAEAVRQAALGAVLLELRGDARSLDLTATRRLSFAAGQSGVTLLLLRLAAAPRPSAATSRWQVAAAPSRPLAANAPGRPAFAIRLLRHRAGLPPQSWTLEWECDQARFAEPAPLPRAVVPPAAGRAAGTPGGPLRRAG